MRKLIEGSIIKEKGIYTPHISIIYNDLKSYIYLAVADISRSNPERTKLCFYRDLFKKAHSDYKYLVYKNYIVIVISVDKEFKIKRDLKKLIKLFDEHNIVLGISSCFENLFLLRDYFFEAVDALLCGIESGGDEKIYMYKNQVRD